MTFLRHPVDNLISIYFFWRALPEPGHALHARFLRERPSILRTSETIERLELEADVSIRRRLTDLLAADVAFYDRLRR
jgi:hypothetical protein